MKTLELTDHEHDLVHYVLHHFLVYTWKGDWAARELNINTVLKKSVPYPTAPEIESLLERVEACP